MKMNKYKHLLKDCKIIIEKFNAGQNIDSGDLLNLALSYSIATYEPDEDNTELKDLLNK